MEQPQFEVWLDSVSASFVSLSDAQRNASLDRLISLSGASQLRHLSNGLEALVKRDFVRLLPLELSFYLLRWLDPETLLTCCLVCKTWNKVISSCTEVWQGVCSDLGWRIDESVQELAHAEAPLVLAPHGEAPHWKPPPLHAGPPHPHGEAPVPHAGAPHPPRPHAGAPPPPRPHAGAPHPHGEAPHWKAVYLKARRRMTQLQEQRAFETSSLIGHSARVYALYYRDGLLCTGSDDLSAKLWDVRTGQCVYGIQTHTCATVKFDDTKLVTGSFDNTVACWEWSTGAKIQQFRGHTGAVFSVDYNDGLDVLVSGSADFTVKVWALTAGVCLNTLTGHTEWVTKVILQQSEVESVLHSPGDYILLSADKYEIKVWPLGREINCACLKTLCVSADRSVSLQPRLQFDGRSIVCSSDLGVYQWDFSSFEVIRVIKVQDPANLSLLSFGEVFALLFDNHFLYVMDLRTEVISGRWPLPAYRKSKRGSSFLPGGTSWLHGLDGRNDSGLVFATSMPDHSIHLVLWKENG